MEIDFDGPALHTIDDLTPGGKLTARTLDLAIPDLDDEGRAETVRYVIEGAPAGFLKLSYNGVELGSGHGAFRYDPDDDHELRLEFDTTTLPTAQQEQAPQWRGVIRFRVGEVDSPFYVEALRVSGSPRMFDGIFAVDLGTTNASVASWSVKPVPTFDPESPTLFGEEAWVPSAINVVDGSGFRTLEAGSYEVGRKALASSNTYDLHRSVKRGLGTRKRYEITRKDRWDADAEQMLVALAKEVLADARATLGGGAFPEVLVTTPPQWTAVQMAAIRRVFKQLGFADKQIDLTTDEATAAGLNYLLQPLMARFGQRSKLEDYIETHYGAFKDAAGVHRVNVLSMDFGGGTTDLALMEVEVALGARVSLRVNVRDRGGRQNLGGDNLTLALFHQLKRRLALALAHPARVKDPQTADSPPATPWLKKVGEPAREALLQQWGAALANLDAPAAPLGDERTDWRAAVEGMFPTGHQWEWSQKRRERRANFNWLWEQADSLKREISAKVTQELRKTRGSDGPVDWATLQDFRNLRVPLDLTSLELKAGDARVTLADCLPNDAKLREEFLAVSFGQVCDFYEEVFRDLGAEVDDMTSRSWSGAADKKIGRVVLAGNGARVPAVAALAARTLGVPIEQIEFDPSQAKLAVSKGACLRRIARRVEGYDIDVHVVRDVLPFHVVLRQGALSVPLFPSGQVDELRFFQRRAEEDPDLEYLSRLDPESAADEAYKSFLLLRVDDEHRDGSELALESDELARRLRLPAGPVTSLPSAKALFPSGFQTYDPAQPERKVGLNAVTVPGGTFAEVGGQPVTWADGLELIRNELTMHQKIAWIEREFEAPPPAKTVIHRYYMDATKQVYLVRHHPEEGKALFSATADDAARIELPPEFDPFCGCH